MADQDPAAGGATPPAGSTSEGAKPDEPAGKGATPDAGKDDANTLRDEGKAALEKEREARRDAERRATETERRLAELEDAGKSEVERAIARLDRQASELEVERSRVAELEKKLADQELLELKRTVAKEAGVPLEAAHRLQGTDTRSLTADAKRYLEERPEVADGSIGVGKGGAAAGRAGADMNTLIRDAAGR